MNITIRIMNSEDIAAVAELERELFSDAWNERSLENTLFYRQETSFAAELDGQVAGYLFFMAEADEGEKLIVNEEENQAVKWWTFDEALKASTEPWFVEHIYKKLIERCKHGEEMDLCK